MVNLRITFLLAVFIALYSLSANARSDINEEYIEQLNHSDPQKRIEAIRALGNRGIKATQKSAVKLIDLLKDENKEVRQATIKSLGQMGVEGKRAGSHLIELLDDPDPDIRNAAALSLKRIGSVKGKAAVKRHPGISKEVKKNLYKKNSKGFNPSNRYGN